MKVRITRTALLLAAAVSIAVVEPAAALDCGGQYAYCLKETTGTTSSDWLHEAECYSAYWKCVVSLIHNY